MGFLYNLDPLSAIDLFYCGEKDGVWEGDFIKNEKKRGLALPPDVRGFLENYGYLDINKNEASFRLFIPDDMGEIHLQTDIGEVPILVIGTFQNLLFGIRLDTSDLKVAFGEQTEKGTMWSPVNLSFTGVLTTMLVSLLFQSEGHSVFEGPSGIDSAIEAYQIDCRKVRPSEGCPQHFSLNYNEEKSMFLIGEFDEQCEEIVRFHAARPKTFTLEELEQLFNREFYQNALHCDFGHALRLQLAIIERLEGAKPVILTEHYKLAGRCCWALGKLTEAESWYEKGLAIVENSLEQAPDKTADYYHAMGNFYADTNQQEKRDKYYAMELGLLQKYFPNDAYKMGLHYQSRAQFLIKNQGDPDEAIELYNKALEEFQKDPKGCKYEISRTQQLRGEAKRIKKRQ